jgi:uncharacterized protein YegL
MSDMPDDDVARRPLQLIYLADCSGSMAGRKIETLNLAVRESIEPMRAIADETPNAEVFVRAIRFSDGAQWHISQPTEIHAFTWRDLDADGVTDMGKALTLAAEALKIENMPTRSLPPVLVLLSDGQPTDDFNGGLKSLLDQPWGKRAIRIGIGIGDDADMAVLTEFIANNEIKPLQAKNVEDLVKFVKWASTAPLKAASNPDSKPIDAGRDGGARVRIPAPLQQLELAAPPIPGWPQRRRARRSGSSVSRIAPRIAAPRDLWTKPIFIESSS